MSLDPLHEQLARVALALPEAGNAALAGGGTMLAHGLVDRPTRDLDLFAPDPGDVMRFADALVAAFTSVGAQVAPDRRDPGFVRIVVTLPGERAVAVEIALGMQTPHSRSSAWTPRPAGTCGAGQRHGVSDCSARRRWPRRRRTRSEQATCDVAGGRRSD